MIKFHRSARIRAGKALDAIALGQEIAQYITKQYPQYRVQFFVERYGDPNRVHWLGEAADVATADDVLTKLMSDAGYLAIAARAPEVFIEGSVQDVLMVSV